MVSTLYRAIGNPKNRVSKTGIVFKKIKTSKGIPPGIKIAMLEKKYGAKKLEVIKKKGKYTYWVRTGKKIKPRFK